MKQDKMPERLMPDDLADDMPRRAQRSAYGPRIISVTTREPARTPRAHDNSREDWASEFDCGRYVMIEELHGVLVMNKSGQGVAVLLPWPTLRHVVYAVPQHIDPPSSVPGEGAYNG